MSSYNLGDLLQKWEREEITVDQAIGQIILSMVALSRRLGHLERRLEDQRMRGSGDEITPPETTAS